MSEVTLILNFFQYLFISLLLTIRISNFLAFSSFQSIYNTQRTKTTVGCRREDKCASGFFRSKDYIQNNWFLMLSEKKSRTDNFQHGGWHKVSGRKEQREWTKDRRNTAEVRRPNIPAVFSWTGDRGDSREEAESLPEAAPGMVEELLVCWDRQGQRERQHTSFCYCVGEGEKDGGIILMA